MHLIVKDFQFNNKEPIYLQIIDLIKKNIASGKLKPGEKLPSVREMSSTLGVNPNTLQRAYGELEKMGITYTKRGMGSFISESLSDVETVKIQMGIDMVKKFLEDMNSMGVFYQLMPIVCCVCLFKAYKGVLYSKGTRINIIPESNKEKLRRIFKVYIIWFLVITIANFFMYKIIYNLSMNEGFNLLGKALESLAGPTMYVLSVILMDMECKDSKMSGKANVFWNILCILIVGIATMPIMLIYSAMKVSDLGLYFTFVIISLIEGVYIFKRINNIKINS